ncbi:hypothetical protein MLD38_009834 [Melastoma candidum]|uniref:Uncharacterized protein n=1 Tax=Melastoma candidum TaxID=119954 RepID=A0ACB9RZD5_9MYRT|nr:hypothetical protein MLD38_009834 [Melastoma candidum]
MGRQSSSQSLAPGFRFHPTDEELVRYYLMRKVSGKRLRFDPISEIDIYKSEPWDLPPKSKLQTGDLEWYFFSVLDKKYGNGSKTNRATEHGYWKTTGKDRPVCNGPRTVGMKKTLVYHNGRAPRGQRSNWVMHEYRLMDEVMEKARVPQEAFVLCRVFQKSGPGPKNGEQYGAPFIEAEWEDDDVAIFPDQEPVVVTNDAYFETDDLDQSIGNNITPGSTSLLANPLLEAANSSIESYEEVHGAEQKPLVIANEVQNNLGKLDESELFCLPEQYPADGMSFQEEFVGESSINLDIPKIEDPVDVGNLFDGPYLDAIDDAFFGDVAYLENELSRPIDYDADNFSVGEYLTFSDPDNENLFAEHVTFDQISAGEVGAVGDKEQPLENQHVADCYKNDLAFSSNQYAYAKDPESNIKYPFMKSVSHMLGSFPAPPAFAAEFPAKDTILRLNAIAQPSSSIRRTAGMLRTTDTNSSSPAVNWSYSKNGELNLVLSFGVSPVHDAITSTVFGSRGKTSWTASWSWLLCLFFWGLLLSVTVRAGSALSARGSGL